MERKRRYVVCGHAGYRKAGFLAIDSVTCIYSSSSVGTTLISGDKKYCKEIFCRILQ